MDQMMPDMDGIETTRHIRAINGCEKLPVIAMTANALADDRDLLLSAGMNGYVSKPINQSMLNAVLAQWLPPEKLVVEGGTAPVFSAEDARLIEPLRAVPMLDVDVGLANVADSARGFFDALRQFHESLSTNVAAMERYLADGDLEKYHVKVHAFKGMLRTIGAGGLGDEAAELETLAKDALSIREKHTPFIESLQAFDAALGKAGVFARPEKTRGDRAALHGLLSALFAACQNSDVGKSLDLAGKLEMQTYNQDLDREIARVCAWVRSFDFDEAEEALAALLNASPQL
jgi:HPt (histidine-containing phosphotransfer) domain-containing protein